MIHSINVDIEGRSFVFETGRVAAQADGAVMTRFGDTMVFVSVVGSRTISPSIDFFPLMVDYRERTAAAGKIPGGFYKREGRPSDGETLAARQIDRSIRPLFPKEFKASTHVVCLVFSADLDNDPDVLGINGASAALMISDLPFDGPVSAVRVGRVEGAFVVNPTYAQLEASDLDIVVCATLDAVAMVEGSGKEIPEQTIFDALQFAEPYLHALNQAQVALRTSAGKAKRTISAFEIMPQLLPTSAFTQYEQVLEHTSARIPDLLTIHKKKESQLLLDVLAAEFYAQFDLTGEGVAAKLKQDFQELVRTAARSIILESGARVDGRAYHEIRPISIEIDVLPRSHGSALFTRGETQSIVTTTLGTTSDEQIIDALEGESTKKFMLHYNFPPFCVGEAGILRGPGRREVGHGALAERALLQIMPHDDSFPYTIRIVSDILSSNGSSSMATVCGATLALMDAGVPISSPVAGIAMGLIKDQDRVIILSDISGLEDHTGDMDFKVAGTANGITAIQMDIKIKGIASEVLKQALDQARQGRLAIISQMLTAIPEPRSSIKPHAPRITILKINPEKIGTVIGPQGKIIRKIILETNTKIDIEDDGTVMIAAIDEASCLKAKEYIEQLSQEAEIGRIYSGIINRVEPYGVFVEIFSGVDGLLHISEIAEYRINDIRSVYSEGDKVEVKVIDIDQTGKVRLGLPERLKREPGTEQGQEDSRPDRPKYVGGSRDRQRPYDGNRNRNDSYRGPDRRGDRPPDRRGDRPPDRRGDRPPRRQPPGPSKFGPKD